MRRFDSVTTLAAIAGAMLVACASPGTGAAPSSPEAKAKADPARPPVETKSAPVPSPTTARPEPAKDAAPVKGEAGSTKGLVPKVSLTATGAPFQPRMAYIVGPASYGRVTLVVTSEEPHDKCALGAAARDSAKALKVRLMYGPTSSVVLDKPRTEKGNLRGSGAFIELTKDETTTQLAGAVNTLEAPAGVGQLAKYRLDVSGGGMTIKGETQALLCVTKAEINE